jgi:GNAT superfamily N-acetyltransferase
MNTAVSRIVPVTGPDRVDAAAVADLIAEAFHPLPPAAWLVPDPGARSALLAGQFEILAEHALVYGMVHRTDGGDAVAVWFPRVEPVPDPVDYERRLATACGDAVARFQVLDALLEDHHPTEPHHHLALLAVRPGRQGRGLGTALLDHHHGWLDSRGLPAYLEASSERNLHFYRRHGYREVAPLRLPDGTPFWPMWRAPRRPGVVGG